jgi:hypothetical protein
VRHLAKRGATVHVRSTPWFAHPDQPPGRPGLIERTSAIRRRQGDRLDLLRAPAPMISRRCRGPDQVGAAEQHRLQVARNERRIQVIADRARQDVAGRVILAEVPARGQRPVAGP